MDHPSYAVVGPFHPHPGRAHLVQSLLAEDIAHGEAQHPVRARCGLVVTSIWMGRVGTRFGWGVNLWGKAADYHARCKTCWKGDPLAT